MTGEGTSIWGNYKLGDLASFATGKLDSNASKPHGEYPFFTCSRETFKTDTYSFDCECVLLAGNNAAGIYPLKYFKGKFDAYQRTYVIRSSDNRRLTNRFLFYALQPKLELLKSISTGVATKFLTLTILKDQTLSIPHVDIQNKITSILSAYDDLIENNTRRIKNLEEMAQSIYREWFVNFRFPGREKVKMVDSPMGKIPGGWETKKFSEIAEISKGRKPKQVYENQENGFVPQLLIDVLRGSKPSYTGLEGMVEASEEDTMMVMDGSGSAAVFIGFSGAVGSTLARIRTQNVKKFPPYVLYLFLLTRQEEIKGKNVGAAIPHANKDFINSMLVATPPEKINTEFHITAGSLYSMIKILRKKTLNLRQTRDLLLPKLTSGELDVSELDIKTKEIGK